MVAPSGTLVITTAVVVSSSVVISVRAAVVVIMVAVVILSGDVVPSLTVWSVMWLLVTVVWMGSGAG